MRRPGDANRAGKIGTHVGRRGGRERTPSLVDSPTRKNKKNKRRGGRNKASGTRTAGVPAGAGKGALLQLDLTRREMRFFRREGARIMNTCSHLIATLGFHPLRVQAQCLRVVSLRLVLEHLRRTGARRAGVTFHFVVCIFFHFFVYLFHTSFEKQKDFGLLGGATGRRRRDRVVTPHEPVCPRRRGASTSPPQPWRSRPWWAWGYPRR